MKKTMYLIMIAVVLTACGGQQQKQLKIKLAPMK